MLEVLKVLKVLEALRGQEPETFAAIGVIGLAGQMHGLVSPEASLKPSYPAIVWLDQRSAAQVSCIYDTLDPACLARHLQNRFYPGYAPPRLLWLHDEATEIYRKIARALCLKDCIRLKLTGNWAANRRMLWGHACMTLKKRLVCSAPGGAGS